MTIFEEPFFWVAVSAIGLWFAFVAVAVSAWGIPNIFRKIRNRKKKEKVPDYVKYMKNPQVVPAHLTPDSPPPAQAAPLPPGISAPSQAHYGPQYVIDV